MSSVPTPANNMMRRAIWLLCCVLSVVCEPAAVRAVTVPSAEGARAATSPRVAAWPFSNRPGSAACNGGSCPVGPQTAATPHPAVARIVVPEQGATAFGSGTLIDVRDEFGLVVTNWHVVRDSQGVVEVKFPGGFRSHARPLKVDSDWDLAALVIWRPPVEPVRMATHPPRPGEPLTIHGYGQGQYRIATGRCTAYYAPRRNFPQEMLELDVEARQGDSGGPIFNSRGELAGVLFGAGQGTTLGSYAPRVSNFLATLAPDIGGANDQLQVAIADRPAPNVRQAKDDWAIATPTIPSSPWSAADSVTANSKASQPQDGNPWARFANVSNSQRGHGDGAPLGSEFASIGWYDSLKSALAVVGIVAIVFKLVKAAG
ncbi:MAG TPA: serine protease [Lacipirellulaceae bacterium]|nr:serine protease [Lacipirellulaceae bacterium]